MRRGVGAPGKSSVDAGATIVPSRYPKDAKATGLDIVTATPERSGILANGNSGFCCRAFDRAIRREGDAFGGPDVIARQIGGVSDRPATVTLFADCLGPKQAEGG